MWYFTKHFSPTNVYLSSAELRAVESRGELEITQMAFSNDALYKIDLEGSAVNMGFEMKRDKNFYGEIRM